jgi:hypothetical protein
MTDTPRTDTSETETDEDTQTPPARRRFLQVAAGTIALGIAGCSGSSGGGGGSNKSPKSKVSYQDHPQNGQQCSECQYFIASAYDSNTGKCEQVKGKISYDGWCSLFSPQ